MRTFLRWLRRPMVVWLAVAWGWPGEVWQSSFSIAEVSKKTGIRKKAVHVRAYRYRRAVNPLKDFPPVELPDWDQLAEYARSLLPEGAVATGVGRRDEDEEYLEHPSDIEKAQPRPVGIEEE